MNVSLTRRKKIQHAQLYKIVNSKLGHGFPWLSIGRSQPFILIIVYNSFYLYSLSFKFVRSFY